MQKSSSLKVNTIAKVFYDHFLHHADEFTGNTKTLEDYVRFCEPIVQLCLDNCDKPLAWFYETLYASSNIEKSVRYMVEQKKYVAGMVFCFGTQAYSDRIVIGNQQESVNEQFQEERMLEDSIFDLASLTKFFTCLCTLKLAEQKMIDVYSRVTDVEPRFVHLRNLTILELLSFSVSLKTKGRLDEVNSKGEAEELLFEAYADPEDTRLYSDIAPMIIKVLLEKVSGNSMWKLIENIILNPCEMMDTFMEIPEELYDRVVSNNYERRVTRGNYVVIDEIGKGCVNDGKARRLNVFGIEAYGHAGLFSTSQDLEKLVRCFMDEKIISRESMELIGINRTGRRLSDETYTQFHGLLSYSKNPIEKYSEVSAWLSGNAFALGGYTGNHMAVDLCNGIYTILLSNRCHNRVTNIVPASEQDQHVFTEKSGMQYVRWIDDKKYPFVKNYAFDRDDYIIRPATELALQYAIVERVFQTKEKEHREKIHYL